MTCDGRDELDDLRDLFGALAELAHRLRRALARVDGRLGDLRSLGRVAGGLRELLAYGSKPRLRARESITDYPPQELVALVRWIQSDGVLRTDEELIREAFDELPFQQLGSRIRQCLAEAVERSRRG